jgi:hypothetical protein
MHLNSVILTDAAAAAVLTVRAPHAPGPAHHQERDRGACCSIRAAKPHAPVPRLRRQGCCRRRTGPTRPLYLSSPCIHQSCTGTGSPPPGVPPVHRCRRAGTRGHRPGASGLTKRLIVSRTEKRDKHETLAYCRDTADPGRNNIDPAFKSSDSHWTDHCLVHSETRRLRDFSDGKDPRLAPAHFRPQPSSSRHSGSSAPPSPALRPRTRATSGAGRATSLLPRFAPASATARHCRGRTPGAALATSPAREYPAPRQQPRPVHDRYHPHPPRADLRLR